MNEPTDDDTAPLRPVLDAEALRVLGENTRPELIRHLVRQFVDELEQQCAELEQAVISEDMGSIARNAHKLKSSAPMFGAMALSSCAIELDTLARTEDRKALMRAKDAVSIVHRTVDALHEICPEAR